MKLKCYVGIVLVLTLLSYFAITLFGTQSPLMTGIIFFNISFLILVSVIVWWKSSSKDSMFFIIFEIFFLCALFSVLLGGAKLYQTETVNHDILLENLNVEINAISKYNDYYSDYIDYLKSELSVYVDGNAKLMRDIEKEKSKIMDISQVTAVSVPFENIIYEEHYEENDYDGYHEDEEDEDD